MEKEEIKSLLHNMGIDRHQIFISLSSKDKELALPLLQMMDTRKMNYWCMYYANGAQRNIVGDNYEKTIEKNIKHCCLFVFLFSKFSVSSIEVKKELQQISQAIRRNEHIRVIPISLDETTVKDLPSDIVDMGLFDKGLIYRQMGDSSKDNNEMVMSELRTQYYDMLFENIAIGYHTIEKSYLFTDLLMECIHRRCQARTVSQDIKASDEGNKESLLEAHIITDEILEYDFHPYSCMLISSNLLGNYDESKQNFNPEANGVKYFYYCTEPYIDEIGEAFRQKMKDYILRNRISRGEVVLLIRREFTERNKLLYFIDSFNGLTATDILNKYNITEEEDKKVFQAEFEKDENNVYFIYTESDDEVFQVPEELYTWLSDDKSQLYNDSIRKEAYLFIDFINRLSVLLDKVQTKSPAREELVKQLKKYCRYFNQLVSLERWQMRDEGFDLSVVAAKKLCNHLIGFSEGASISMKEFPNLSNWMKFFYDSNGNLDKLNESIVDRALNNLVFIPIRENSTVKPCYSFVVYINKNSTHASWYSTGYEENGRNMVIAYEANPDAGECKAYLDAFLGLIAYNQPIKQILIDNNSKILDRGLKELSNEKIIRRI